MYTAHNAIGIRLGLNKRWETIDMTAWTMAQLFTTFRRVQLQMTAQNSTTPLYADLAALANLFGTSPLTIQQALNNLGSTTIVTTTTGLVLNQQKAVWADAFAQDYTALPVTASNGVDPLVFNDTLPNIRLTNIKRNVDYLQFFGHVMVNVNGYWHRIDTDGTHGINVYDAMKSMRQSGQNQIGLWNFEAMCDITYVPITTDMVHLNSGMPSQVTVTLSQDMTNKSIMLVLGGYLVLLDGVALAQTGSSSYTIDFTQLGLVDRYYESLNYLDLSSLNIQPASGNSSQIAISDLTTTAAMNAWLALSQTFFVVLNTSEVYSQKLAVKSSGLPSLYTTYQVPSSPLVLELGRMPPYWVTEEDQQYSLAIYDNLIANKLYYSNPLPQWISTSGANMPGMPGHLSRASLLEIGRDV